MKSELFEFFKQAELPRKFAMSVKGGTITCCVTTGNCTATCNAGTTGCAIAVNGAGQVGYYCCNGGTPGTNQCAQI